jgi:hypothetical protein
MFGGGGLWTYNLVSGRANLLANMPFNAGVSSIGVSTDKSYIYIAQIDSQNRAFIKRVGLRGQNVPNYVFQLQDFLPVDINSYSISLINFSRPEVVVLQLPTSPPTYLQQAKGQLQKSGFDLTKLEIITATLDSNLYE